MFTADTLTCLLQSKPLPLHNEKATQLALDELLRPYLPITTNFQREADLGDGDIIDFLLGDCWGIEVKIKGAPAAIYRQCERYCRHPQIERLWVVTGKSLVLPALIEDKPVRVVSLGQAWL